MKWFIGLVGLFWIILGIANLVATKKTILALYNFIKNTSRQTLGILGLVFGLLFLISASSTKASWFILMLGILACLKGIGFILISEQKFKSVVDWWLAAPEIVYKGWAVFLLVLGVAVFYIL